MFTSKSCLSEFSYFYSVYGVQAYRKWFGRKAIFFSFHEFLELYFSLISFRFQPSYKPFLNIFPSFRPYCFKFWAQFPKWNTKAVWRRHGYNFFCTTMKTDLKLKVNIICVNVNVYFKAIVWQLLQGSTGKQQQQWSCSACQHDCVMMFRWTWSVRSMQW